MKRVACAVAVLVFLLAGSAMADPDTPDSGGGASGWEEKRPKPKFIQSDGGGAIVELAPMRKMRRWVAVAWNSVAARPAKSAARH